MTTEVQQYPDRINIQQWLVRATGRISVDHPSALPDLRVLLAHHLNQSSSWVLAHPEYLIPLDLLPRLDTDLSSYALGTPLPYLTGRMEFYGHPFMVSPNVLIPRPETELLVDTALLWLQRHPQKRMMDVGTGSACIPISIALVDPTIHCLAVDISWPALQVARINRRQHNLDNRLHLVCSDLASGLDLSSVHLVTANLPYIPTDDLHGLEVARHEPSLALDGGEDGLRLIDRLLYQCSLQLSKPFCILLEIEYRQADSVQEIARRYFNSDIEIHSDLAGLARLAEIRGD